MKNFLRFLRLPALFAFWLVAVQSGYSFAATVTLEPTADAYVLDGAWANSNFGGANPMFTETRTSTGSNYDSYLKFDTASVGGAGSVASAKLRVSASKSGPGVGMAAYAVADTAWAETAITWNNKPARGATLGSVTVAGVTYVYYEFDVSSYVIGEKAAGRNLMSFALHNPEVSSQAIYLLSREATSGRPQLVLTLNAAPTVALTAPAANAVFLPPANVTVSATAADADGTIAKVDFFDGPTLVGTATAAPYSVTLANLAVGTHTLSARATDNLGLATTSSAVTIRVDAPPAVSLTAPANNSVFLPPATITLSASASDPDGSLAKVDFYDGATLVGTVSAAPYSLSLTNVAAGSHSYTARATDNDGAVTTSAAVSVRVDAVPAVSITSPAAGAVFSAPASITLTASATDPDGTIAKVDFYQGATLLGTATASPYAFSVSNLAAGSYSFTAVATDNDGAQTTSAAVAVTVNAPPTVSLTSPANNATFTAPADITITADAQDSDGTIAQVEFFNGTTLIATDTTAPYSILWTGVPAGSYSLTARVTDNLGATATSTAVNVTVTAAVGQIFYIHADHLNTPRRIYNQGQQLVWSWDHAEPFGSNPPNENPSGLGNFTCNLRLPGQYFDQETNLHYNYYRDYDPTIGRYIQSDPIGLHAGLNTYVYVSSNPLWAIDPSGLAEICRKITENDWQPIGRGWKIVDYKFMGGNNTFSDAIFNALTIRLPGVYFARMVPIEQDLQLEQEIELLFVVCVDECTKQTSKRMISKRLLEKYREVLFNPSTARSGDPVWVKPWTPPPSMFSRWGVR